MLEAEAEGVPSEEQQHQVGPEDTPPAAPAEGTEERAVESEAAPSAAPEEGTEEQLEEAGEAPVLHTTTAPAEVPNARTEEPAAVPVLDTTGPVEAPNGQTEEPAAKEGGAVPTQHTVSSVESPVDQFKHRKFFVLRVNTFTFLFDSREVCAALICSRNKPVLPETIVSLFKLAANVSLLPVHYVTPADATSTVLRQRVRHIGLAG